ncbi:MAG: sodium:solute symporter family protein [Deltaproteobacteria bacterium]|nr:sodium:solute symporter family protein [Deltaproteobacteria bacterium]MBK8713363.1 sodium:solute symporter family protein [Deltaproteobacteria bacterium]
MTTLADPGLVRVLGATVIGYVLVMFAIGWWTRSRVHDHEDFMVAGRRLPLHLAWATIVATWFGAGAMLTATDTVRAQGLIGAALDPIGAGLCLFLAGWLIARPLWEMKLLTLPDFYGRRFGVRTERLSAVLMIPTYFGWIAAQFVALAHLIEILFGLDVVFGIPLVAIVGMIYTLLGGMWSVTLTDAAQIAVVALGLVVLTLTVLAELGGGSSLSGLEILAARTPAPRLSIVPDELPAIVTWLGVVSVGALGNLPGQDLTQRIFSARSGRTAVWACHIAGVVYFGLGAFTLVLGLSADLVAPGLASKSTVAMLASLFLSPPLAVLFVLAVMSAVLSTIDSAILSPASVLAQNLLAPRWPSADLLRLNRWSVIAVTLVSIATAYLGESAYSLLESAYELGLVSLLVPLLMGIRTMVGAERAALASMIAGTVLWALHFALGWESFLSPWIDPLGLPLPMAASCALCAWAVYLVVARGENERHEHGLVA